MITLQCQSVAAPFVTAAYRNYIIIIIILIISSEPSFIIKALNTSVS